MKYKTLYVTAICILLIGICVALFMYERRQKISNLKKQSQYLIQKVEAYKKKNHKLPQYMDDMHLDLSDDYPISYSLTHDSLVYVVGFQIAPFSSMVYYSDTKMWASQQ
jgi:hypothetical protein